MRTLTRRVATGAAAALAASVLGLPTAHAGPAVSYDEGGRVETWGVDGAGGAVRSTHGDGRYVAVASGGAPVDDVRIAVTDMGRLEVLSGSHALREIPDGFLAGKRIEGLQMGNSQAVAWTSDGDVDGWATSRALSFDGITGHVDEVGLGAGFAVMRMSDGTLQSTGTGAGVTGVPARLKDASAPGFVKVVKVAANSTAAVALLADGTLEAWGTAAQVSGYAEMANVVDFAVSGAGTTVLLADGTLAYFGNQPATRDYLPVAPAGTRFVKLAATNASFAGVTDAGRVLTWAASPAAAALVDPPADLQGVNPAAFGAGHSQYQMIVTEAPELTRTEPGSIAGTAKVGQKLTGTPATFSVPVATVSTQWRVGEQVVGTGTTFTPTAAQVGKRVTFRTTATYGADTVTDEVSTANVAPATVPKASTSVAVSGATTAAYGSTVRWTVTVRGGSPAGGTVTVAGSGVNVRAAVSRGRAVVTLPRTLAPASRTLRVTYSGDGTHLASSRNLGLRVVKANVSAAAKVTKKPTSRKAGKVRVTVRGAGPVRAGGRVTVTIQKGSKRYTVRGNVRSNGTVDLTLRKLAKGTWTVKAVYAGDARYNARATGAVRVKVSK